MAGKLCFFRLNHGSVARLGVCQFNNFSMLGNLSIANTGHGDIYYKNAKKHTREVHINTIRCVAVPSSKICSCILVVFRLMKVRRWRWDSEGRALLPCLLLPHQSEPAPCISAKLEKKQISRCLKMDSIFKNIDPWSYSWLPNKWLRYPDHWQSLPHTQARCWAASHYHRNSLWLLKLHNE